jgi:rRNA-processing protein EBP2
MAKTMKLKSALDRHKGVNHKLEKQKKQQKEAEKRKRAKQQPAEAQEGGEEDEEEGEQDADFAALENMLAGAEVVEIGGDEDVKVDRRQKPSKGNRKERRAAMLAAKAAAEAQEISNGAADEEEHANGEAEGWETDENEDTEGGVEVGAMSDESESDSEIENEVAEDDEDEYDEDDEEDIPLSDLESLASADKEDMVPHQRLTINNTAALARSLKSFALPASLPFSAVQAVTSEEPVNIPDVEDDLNRELAFYRQSLNAVTEARSKLKAEGVSFSRPTDYFAEMVKSEEQMGKVRAKLLDETARKKASSDARRQRDLKKFGKQVQVAKLQERQKEKTATLDRIQTLKRSKHRSHKCVGVQLEANSMQNVKAQTSQQTNPILSMSRSKTPPRPPQRTRQTEERRAMARERGKRRMRSLGLEGRSDLERVTTPRVRRMTAATLCVR